LADAGRFVLQVKVLGISNSNRSGGMRFNRSGFVAEGQSKLGQTLLTWGSLALAAAESVCVLAVSLSGVRVLLGMTSLIAATAGGPARGFHSNALRIPFLAAGAFGALLSLFLLWNEEKIRRNPSAAWRLRPQSAEQRRRRWLQIVLAILTLLLVAAEVITHSWFHHEL
jgi:hypothetical protein